MFENPHLTRVRRSFADQFQPEGDGFIYRKAMKGAPIVITAAERDRFISDFNRRLRWLMWGVMAATIALVGVLAMVTVTADAAPGDVWAYAPAFLLAGGFTAAVMAAWNAPARALAHRTPVGVPLSREEARRAALTRITWGQLVSGAAVWPVLALWLSSQYDLFHGWSRLWLVFLGAGVALTLFAGYRKWRYGRAER